MVVDDAFTPIVGDRAAQQIGFLVVQHQNRQLVSNIEAPTDPQATPFTKDQVLTEFTDVTNRLGRMQGKLHMSVDESFPPVIMPPAVFLLP